MKAALVIFPILIKSLKNFPEKTLRLLRKNILSMKYKVRNDISKFASTFLKT